MIGNTITRKGQNGFGFPIRTIPKKPVRGRKLLLGGEDFAKIEIYTTFFVSVGG